MNTNNIFGTQLTLSGLNMEVKVKVPTVGMRMQGENVPNLNNQIHNTKYAFGGFSGSKPLFSI